MLDDLLSRTDLLGWAPAAAGGLCACLVLLAGRLLRRGRPDEVPLGPECLAPRPGIFGPDPFLCGSPSDKRSAPRRAGVPVPVLLGEDGRRADPVQGAVVDRSRGGLAVVMPAAVPAGAVLRVRAQAYYRDMPWVPVRVRHCRRDSGGWVVGCQFVQPQPWSVLLLFG